MSEQRDMTPTDIIVWVCDKCGYWRSEKSTGVHVTANPDGPVRGAMVTHELRPVTYQRMEWNDE